MGSPRCPGAIPRVFAAVIRNRQAGVLWQKGLSCLVASLISLSAMGGLGWEGETGRWRRGSGDPILNAKNAIIAHIASMTIAIDPLRQSVMNIQ
jgi:hypothetical protein